jgi:hypothetical protein
MLVFLLGKAMSMDPDKDMLMLPAEAKLGGPKYRPRRPRPNALPRAWRLRVTAPEHDADRTERLVGYVSRCPHRDGVCFRIGENES